MILHVQKKAKIRELQDYYKAILLTTSTHYILVTPSSIKQVNTKHKSDIIESFSMDSDIQLASKKYLTKTRKIDFLSDLSIGGDTKNTVVISGPCSVESEEQITACAHFLNEEGVRILRAGCYKPRTSPYTFQGLGKKGLMLLAKMRDKYNLQIITEAKDATHIDEVIEFADIIQIGAKAMYDHGILRACSKTQKPVLLKRGFGSTIQEFVQSAEFILSGGNPNVILCERGIRTFETKTRFTLDLCGVAYLKEYINLPVILDPSHAMGYAYGIADLTKACVAMGVDGLLIETHPNPKEALSDASQQLNFAEFKALIKALSPIATATGRNLI